MDDNQVGNQQIERCYVHNESSFTYCNICKRIVCSRCSECRMHDIQSTNDAILRNRNRTQGVSIKCYKRGIDRALRGKMEELERVNMEFETSADSVDSIRGKMENIEEGEAKDHALVGGVIFSLKEVGRTAFTQVLRKACEEAEAILDIDEKITEEVKEYPTIINKMRTKIHDCRIRIFKLEAEKEWLKRVEQNSGSDIVDDVTELAFFLAVENECISGYNINCDVEDFVAFPEVSAIFEIGNVTSQKLIDIDVGIQISEPVSVGGRLMKEGENFFVSISHNGIVAVSCKNKFKRLAEFTNLLSNEQIVIEVENISLVGFYDDSVILLTFDYPLRESKVSDIFKGGTTCDMKIVGDVEDVSCWCDVSVLHATRKLYYRSTQYIPYEYDVDKKNNIELDLGIRVLSFPSLTGININSSVVFQCNDERTVYSLGSNQYLTKINAETGDMFLRTVFPSSSDPSNLGKAVMRFQGNLSMVDGNRGGRMVNVVYPVRFETSYSIVRLYKSVFMMYDVSTRDWVLVRILLP